VIQKCVFVQVAKLVARVFSARHKCSQRPAQPQDIGVAVVIEFVVWEPRAKVVIIMNYMIKLKNLILKSDSTQVKTTVLRPKTTYYHECPHCKTEILKNIHMLNL
jgi:hypothetical protein